MVFSRGAVCDVSIERGKRGFGITYVTGPTHAGEFGELQELIDTLAAYSGPVARRTVFNDEAILARNTTDAVS